MRITASVLPLRPLSRCTPQLTHGLAPISVRHAGSESSTWQGRQSHEHITNRDDKLNIQADASKSGKADRVSGSEGGSQATTEGDHGNQNEQAKKDHPEAPGPVIGMNDERGGVST